jgi:SAM-dependent methyltransferase
MTKLPVDPRWFEQLETTEILEHYTWLQSLSNEVDRIINFGCWTGKEPFALLWTLDASEISVVDKNSSHLANLETVKHDINTSSMQGRYIHPSITGDMTQEINEIKANDYDLSYCEEVLYQVYLEGEEKFKAAIRQMIRVVKPGGYIVAVENKVGAVEYDPNTGQHYKVTNRQPIDLTSYFESEGMQSISITNCPPNAYCFKKPSSS